MGLVEARQVDVDHRPEVGVGRGVVDQDVHLAEALDGRCDAGGGRLGVPGVRGEHVQLAPVPPSRMESAAASSASCLRDDSITSAPEAENSAAISRPIPRDAPVTSATLPSSRSSMAAP